MKKCKHSWLPKPMWDLFSSRRRQCTKCRWYKYLVMMKCEDGQWRPRWRIAYK